MPTANRWIRKARRNSDDAYDDAFDVANLDDDAIDAINNELGDDDDDENGGDSAGGRHIEHLADLIIRANPDFERSRALNWLLHSASGQTLVARTQKRRIQKNEQDAGSNGIREK